MPEDLKIQPSVLVFFAGCGATALICAYILISDAMGWSSALPAPRYERPPQRIELVVPANPCRDLLGFR